MSDNNFLVVCCVSSANLNAKYSFLLKKKRGNDNGENNNNNNNDDDDDNNDNNNNDNRNDNSSRRNIFSNTGLANKSFCQELHPFSVNFVSQNLHSSYKNAVRDKFQQYRNNNPHLTPSNIKKRMKNIRAKIKSSSKYKKLKKEQQRDYLELNAAVLFSQIPAGVGNHLTNSNLPRNRLTFPAVIGSGDNAKIILSDTINILYNGYYEFFRQGLADPSVLPLTLHNRKELQSAIFDALTKGNSWQDNNNWDSIVNVVISELRDKNLVRELEIDAFSRSTLASLWSYVCQHWSYVQQQYCCRETQSMYLYHTIFGGHVHKELIEDDTIVESLVYAQEPLNVIFFLSMCIEKSAQLQNAMQPDTDSNGCWYKAKHTNKFKSESMLQGIFQHAVLPSTTSPDKATYSGVK